MAESVINFPFPKLTYDRYLTLEVMKYVEYPEVYQIMYSVTKETRNFLSTNFITVHNGFVNDGLIVHKLENEFNHYWQLERLYL